AADAAVAASPDDASALRARIDALRITGDREGARALVGKVNAPSAETAYVLAALDLAEEAPLWSTVTERLRLAANAESGPGRGRAALVYALARSGDAAGARAEVERLASLPRPHPLLPLLRAYAAAAGPAVAADLDGGAADAGPGGKDKKGRGKMPTDPRQLVVLGDAARVRGDYPRAQALFTSAVEKNPNDTEALSGLAAVAHARRDLNGARASYKRVVSINPSYVPALVGLADVEWESGDRASAMKSYKDIVDRFPDGTYPARVKQRVDGGGGRPKPAEPVDAPDPTGTPTASPPDLGGGG
ncbi:MAG: repeat protein, partial [Labilithrix sp.]|nr:repeat protein [Labilithrix sp.]